jgi:hypothetical protein
MNRFPLCRSRCQDEKSEALEAYPRTSPSAEKWFQSIMERDVEIMVSISWISLILLYNKEDQASSEVIKLLTIDARKTRPRKQLNWKIKNCVNDIRSEQIQDYKSIKCQKEASRRNFCAFNVPWKLGGSCRFSLLRSQDKYLLIKQLVIKMSIFRRMGEPRYFAACRALLPPFASIRAERLSIQIA